MGIIVYPTATDHINKHPYVVFLPPHAQDIPEDVGRKWPVRTSSIYVVGGAPYRIRTRTAQTPSPFYEQFDEKLDQRSLITISRMVTLLMSNTPFTIADDYDVLVILHQIDAYVAENYALRSEPAIMSYFEKILKLRTRIYELFKRVLNRHPQWKTAYTEEHGLFGFIRQLYQPLNITFDMPNTLIEELAICPTVRDHPEIFSKLHPQKTSNVSQDGRLKYDV